jgi:hypothetical protein
MVAQVDRQHIVVGGQTNRDVMPVARRSEQSVQQHQRASPAVVPHGKLHGR